MGIIGLDKNGNELRLGDRCNFEVNKIKTIGIISYEQDYFAYGFDIEDDSMFEVETPCLLMSVADLGSIEKIAI